MILSYLSWDVSLTGGARFFFLCCFRLFVVEEHNEAFKTPLWVESTLFFLSAHLSFVLLDPNWSLHGLSLTQYLFENWLMWLWWMNLKLLMLLLMVNFSGPLCLRQFFFCFAFISINPRTAMGESKQSNITSHYIWWKQYKKENGKENVYRKNPESVEYLIGGIVGILVRLNRRLSEGKSVIDWPFTISSYKA